MSGAPLPAPIRTLVRAAFACAAVACTSEHELGSTCVDGVCETASLSNGVPCLIDTSDLFGVPVDENLGSCIDYEQELRDGLATCRLYLTYPMGTSCEDVGLPPFDDGDPSTRLECELPQLAPEERADTRGAATGWYLADQLDASDACFSIASHRLRFNGVLAAETARLRCTTALAHFSDVLPSQRRGELPVSVSPDSCASLPPLPARQPEDAGTICEPRVKPAGGFLRGNLYVDVRNDQCMSGVCLVDTPLAELRYPCGDPMGCDPELELSDAQYCSCRCDAQGDTSRAPCACPSGYECIDMLSGELPTELAGGYCAREH